MLDVEALTEGGLAAFASTAALDDTIDAYHGYLDSHPGSLKIEQIIAGQLLLDRRWDKLTRFDDSLPVRRDSGMARQALKLIKERQRRIHRTPYA
mgnify:CR=1 FL=1